MRRLKPRSAASLSLALTRGPNSRSGRASAVGLLLVFASCGGGETSGTGGPDTVVLDTADGERGSDSGVDGGEDSSSADVSGDPSEDAESDGPSLGDGELCLDDRECASGVCVQFDFTSDEGFCTHFCLDDEDCDEGDDCVFFVNSGGDAVRVCIPSDLCVDGDEDGYGLGSGCLGGDCDDEDPNVNPAADEVCDFIDNDCDGFRDDNTIGVGLPCETGFAGACSEGTLACVGGAEVCESDRSSGAEVCDGLDNDCDGEIDELEDGTPITAECYGGPEGTVGVGQCVGGVRSCDAGGFGVCDGQVLPFPEICDAEDNDCDGEVDEDAIGGTARCDTGLLGECALGFAGCGEGEGTCVQVNEPSDEVCDGIDNDCDGDIDEGDDAPALTRVCYEGDEETLGVGTCASGQQICDAGDYGPCLGDTPPGIEICDGLDNDCDEEVDEDAVGGGAACSTGLPGICALGVAACESGEGSGCIPILEATDELCDGLDNDCDGEIDESTDGEPLERDCYSGDPDDVGVGICRRGRESCVAGLWSSCVGQVLPGFETCNGADDDCDGEEDEDSPGAGFRCDTGADGACAEGLTACAEGEVTCEATAVPSFEECDGVDNDCDGDIDEDADGIALVRTCYEGDEELIGIGLCVAGEQTCNDGEYGACLGDVSPGVEICDGEDNDCDGLEDEDAIGGGACRTGLSGVCATGVVTCDTGGTTGCVSIIPASDEICDGLDNDCDGTADEGLDGGPLQRVCYDGPEDTAEVGLCDNGMATCTGGTWSACVGQTLPSFEICDDEDNDCDGDIDDGDPAGGIACDTGFFGICSRGLTVCLDGAVECLELFAEEPEGCDGFDNDCDGDVDEGEDGLALWRNCYDGPEGTEGVGSCEGGVQTCRFGDYGGCVGQIIPVTEVCDRADNDCDGEEDEGALLEFFLDSDRDGFGDPETIVMACEGAGLVTNGDDCYDDNSAANPEQEGYFGADRGDGSFDYNCDDAETSFFAGFGSCRSAPPLCFLNEEGWFDDGSGVMPACGEAGIYIFDCLGNGANCDPTTAETTQRCR